LPQSAPEFLSGSSTSPIVEPADGFHSKPSFISKRRPTQRLTFSSLKGFSGTVPQDYAAYWELGNVRQPHKKSSFPTFQVGHPRHPAALEIACPELNIFMVPASGSDIRLCKDDVVLGPQGDLHEYRFADVSATRNDQTETFTSRQTHNALPKIRTALVSFSATVKFDSSPHGQCASDSKFKSLFKRPASGSESPPDSSRGRVALSPLKDIFRPATPALENLGSCETRKVPRLRSARNLFKMLR